MEKPKFSIIVSTARKASSLEPLFISGDEDTEIIIADHNYSKETKDWLTKQTSYGQIVYIPIKQAPRHWKRDFSQGLNMALSYAENEWIIRADDSLELKEDFFEVARQTIEGFKNLKKFIIIGQKAREESGEEKWVDYMSQRPLAPGVRYVKVENPLFTFSFGLFPLKLALDMNGFDIKYDVSWKYDDANWLYRLLRYGYTAMLDKYLYGYLHGRPEVVPKGEPFLTSELFYKLDSMEIENGKVWAYNPYNLKELREKNLEEKEQWTIKKFGI